MPVFVSEQVYFFVATSSYDEILKAVQCSKISWVTEIIFTKFVVGFNVHLKNIQINTIFIIKDQYVETYLFLVKIFFYVLKKILLTLKVEKTSKRIKFLIIQLLSWFALSFICWKFYLMSKNHFSLLTSSVSKPQCLPTYITFSYYLTESFD